MTPSNQQENREPGLDALQALSSIQPPEGMQRRLVENIAERVREQQLRPVARGFRKYAWELWIGASIAVVAAAIVICIFALQAHRTANPSVAANVPVHRVVPALTSADIKLTVPPLRNAAHTNHAGKSIPAASIPHTPPPQPLTAQEHLLLALASNPSLAAGVAQTQTISQHGLGPNALFELDHEQLQPMRSESKLLQPLPPLPHNLP